jgi:hypothetical protein
MDTAHPLENQKSAAIPAVGVDPELKPEDRPTTALVIDLVPGENGVYKVASQAAGGVQLSDTELALVEQFRQSQIEADAKAKAASEADAAKTEVPAASLSEAEQSELTDYQQFQAWKNMQAEQVKQTGQGTGTGTEEYVAPGTGTEGSVA